MGHTARKRFGQHFLHDKNIIRKIIDAIDVEDNISIVEIGPGKGALTIPVLERTGKLDVVEIDRDLAELLSERCRGIGSLTLHVTDAMNLDFCSLGYERIKIIGNLPYNISTPLIFHILDNIGCIDSMLFMLQSEVVERICAGPDTREYGRLSVMVQSRCRVDRLFDIKPNAFQPAPKVNSSMLSLIPDPDAASPVHDQQVFSSVVKQAFNQRRKTIRNSLNGLVDIATFEALGISLKSRAENLSVDDYCRIANLQHQRDKQGPDCE